MSAKPKSKIARNVALRLLYGFASVVFISMVTFLADEVAPGDAAMVRMGEKNFTQERYERLKREMGLDRPWYVRYVEYFSGSDTNEQQRVTVPEGLQSYQLSIRGLGSGTMMSGELTRSASGEEIHDEIVGMLVRGEYESPACNVTKEGEGVYFVEFIDGVGGMSIDDLSIIAEGEEEIFAEELAIGRTMIPFGNSFYGTRDPVLEIIGKVLPISLQLAVLALLFASSVGLTLGTIAAIYENRMADRLALSVSTLGVTVPNFVLAPILAYLFVLKWNMLPLDWVIEEKMLGPQIYYMILPVVVLAARPLATLTRLTRASMIDTLNQEFIKLAVAKGVPSFSLFFKHGLRNAILPVLTGIGTSFGYLLTGSFIVETFFRVPGIGREAIAAIQKGDAPVIMACVIVSGTLFIIINLTVDIVQQFVDPRIRESQV